MSNQLPVMNSSTHPGFNAGVRVCLARSARIVTVGCAQRCSIFVLVYVYRLSLWLSRRGGGRSGCEIWYWVVVVFEDKVHSGLQSPVICSA
jgi:hypothetical protein